MRDHSRSVHRTPVRIIAAVAALGAGTLVATVDGQTVGASDDVTPAVVTPAVVTPAVVRPAEVVGAAGEYHPITPESLLDERVAVSRRVDVDPLPLLGVPDDPTQVLALALSVTVERSDVDGELVAFSSDLGSIPTTTSLTFSTGRPTSALVVVRPGEDGRISMNLAPRGATSGAALVDARVVGWFSTSTVVERGSRLVPRPMRGVFNDALGADDATVVSIRGRGGVPRATTAEAAVLSVTARNASANTVVSLGPDLATATSAGTLVVKKKETTTATLAIVPLDANGAITVHNAAGTVDVALHVVGYTRLGTDETTVTGRLVPLVRPYRAADTTWAPSRSLGPGQAEPWNFGSFVADLTYAGTGESVGSVAAVFGALSAHSHRRQYDLEPVSTTQLRVYPDGRRLPNAPTVTVSEDQRRSNSVLSALSAADALDVYNQRGTTHYRIDLAAVILG